MSTTESVNSLVRDLEQLANEANGKVLGGAYGLQNISAGMLTGGKAKGKKKRRKGGIGTSAGAKKNPWIQKITAYSKEHQCNLKTAMKRCSRK